MGDREGFRYPSSMMERSGAWIGLSEKKVFGVLSKGRDRESVHKALDEMLKDGGSVLVVDGWERNLVHISVESGSSVSLAALLSHDSFDATLMDAKDVDGSTPLAVAAELGNVDAVRLLLSEGMDVNVSDKKGWTPLHFAATTGRNDMAAELLSAGADPEAVDNGGASVVTLALNSWIPNPDMVEMLKSVIDGKALECVASKGVSPPTPSV